MIKPPCRKGKVDCPDRCAGCHSFCKDWKQYEQQKRAEYEKKRIAAISQPQPSRVMVRAIKEGMKK